MFHWIFKTRDLPGECSGDQYVDDSAISLKNEAIVKTLLSNSFKPPYFCCDSLYMLASYFKGRAWIEKLNHGRPPPLAVVSWETNIAMVDATILAQRRLLSKTKDSLNSIKIA